MALGCRVAARANLEQTEFNPGGIGRRVAILHNSKEFWQEMVPPSRANVLQSV